MVLRRLFRRDPPEDPTRELYGRIVAQARQPAFYSACGVPDTVDGRFDLIVLHVFLVMNRLKQEHDRSSAASQALFDLLFLDMDQSLREMGVGDVGVGKRIKSMVQAFYGRLSAYESALKSGEEALKDALKRNLFGTVEVNDDQIDALSTYVQAEVSSLDGQEMEGLILGQVRFGPLSEGRH
ncbi:ubiquinol-cytochrome C chaperone family protein [Pelagibius sp. Alg239-R121]|uniref:ubiquinol-cytochrome C chaperone family protein n=1 Tax=Pelagibius sp. Alg239-R121 TaxID=2993448 RepID=UPI0024A77316|nr:ubiquinol-cytochrome C chaperone family protein [Pelagibius sp. Alg239-R121]